MTAYALRLENGTDTAARVRIGDLLGLAPEGALTAASGIRPAAGAGDVAVVDGTMSVTVQPFVAWVQGGMSDTQGGYPFVLDAELTLVVADGDPTLPRVDTVAAVVHDDAYDGSGLTNADVIVVQGTPGDAAPAMPVNALPLYDVNVPAASSTGTGGLTGANLGSDRRAYLQALGGTPAGSVMPYAGTVEPFGWLIADGRSLPRAQYPRLFEAIGTTYGSVDADTFNLPNLQGRVPVGVDASQAEFDQLGEAGGAKSSSHSHPVSVSVGVTVPAHTTSGPSNHGVKATGSQSMPDNNHTHSVPAMAAYGSGSGSASATAVSALQPYIVLQYLIKW